MSNRWTMDDIMAKGLKVANSGTRVSKNETIIPESGIKLPESGMKLPKKPRKKREEKLQIQIAEYMSIKHPAIIFRSDAAGGIRLTIGQAKINKKMQHSKAYPDMFFAHGNRLFHGLYLELKHSKSEVYRKDGSMVANEHIREQAAKLEALRMRGYAAYFAWGFDYAVAIIENYLRIK